MSPLSSDLNILHIPKNYKGLVHQDAALKYLWERLSDAEKINFTNMWRQAAPPKANVVSKAVFKMNIGGNDALFKIGDFTLYYPDGKQAITVKASSGSRRYQNKNSFRRVGRGCIPPCTDLVLDTFGFDSEVRGVEGRFFPISSLNNQLGLYGRSGFGLHRDANVEGTAGCIAVINDDSFARVRNILYAARFAEIATIPLVIDYDN